MGVFCSYYNEGRCRSCGWIELDYPEQLERKERLICLSLTSSLSLSQPLVLEKSVFSPVTGFRNRAKMTVTGPVERAVIGLVGETSLDEGRELLACPIHHPKLNEVIAAMPELIRDFNLIPYRIAERKGELKGLILFYSPGSDQMYLRFILRSKECVSRIRKLLPRLQNRFPSVVCVSANLQAIPHAVLEGEEEIILTDRKWIDHQIGPLRLRLAPQAFVQTNVQVASELYQAAARWVAEAHPARMLELFSGQGAFSFFSAKSSGEILGVELNPEAVAMANETSRSLGTSHIRFTCADATQVDKAITAFHPGLILVNPPRRGLGEGVELVRKAGPKDLIYSSCSIETLSNDLKKLSAEYRLKKAQLFDLFPHTEHFETLVWLERVSPLR